MVGHGVSSLLAGENDGMATRRGVSPPNFTPLFITGNFRIRTQSRRHAQRARQTARLTHETEACQIVHQARLSVV